MLKRSQYLLWSTMKKGSPPKWEDVLKLQTFPDMNLIRKEMKMSLPKPLTQDTDGFDWRGWLSTDDMTDIFIKNIKNGNYHSERLKNNRGGIGTTIREITRWKENPNAIWDRMPAVFQLRFSGLEEGMEKNSKKKILNRINRIVQEALPELEKAKSAGLSEGIAQSGRKTYDVTKEAMDEHFAPFFTGEIEVSDEEKLSQIEYVNDELLAERKRMVSTKKFLQDASYAVAVRKFLRKIGWDKKFNVTVRDDGEIPPELQKYNFEKKDGKWVTEYEGDRRLIRGDIQEVSNARIDILPLPIVEAFGTVKSEMIPEEQEPRLGELKYKIHEPFTSLSALTYLNQLKRMRGLRNKFVPEKILDMMQSDVTQAVYKQNEGVFIDHYIQNLLGKKYDSFSDDDAADMAQQFMTDMESQLIISDKYWKLHYVRKIYDASELDGDDYDENDYWYWKDITEPWEKAKKDILKELSRPRTREDLDNDILSEQYTEVKEDYDKSFAILRYSISPSEKEIIKELLRDFKKKDSELLDIDRLNILLRRLNDTQKEGKANFIPKKIEQHGEELDIFLVAKNRSGEIIEDRVSHHLIQEILEFIKDSSNNYIQLYQEDLKEYEEKSPTSIKDIQQVWTRHGATFDFEFDEEAFSNDLERAVAEIVYRGLLSDKTIPDILTGNVVTAKQAKGLPEYDFETLLTLIISLGSNVGGGELQNYINEAFENAREEVLDDMDFNSDPPPLKEEIQAFSRIVVDSIPKIRELLIQDVREKVQDMIDHPTEYRKKEKSFRSKSKKKSKVTQELMMGASMFTILLKNNIIQRVR